MFPCRPLEGTRHPAMQQRHKPNLKLSRSSEKKVKEQRFSWRQNCRQLMSAHSDELLNEVVMPEDHGEIIYKMSSVGNSSVYPSM